MSRAGDDAERSDEEERRMIPAGDDAERAMRRSGANEHRDVSDTKNFQR